MEEMDKVGETNGETQNTAEPESTRTVSNLFNTSVQDGTSETIEILDPDRANTKGRSRMLSIKEKIKQNKFYKCSHRGSTSDTKDKCDNKHLVYNLPKMPKRTRKSKPKEAGTDSPAKKTTKRGERQ